ncbi:type IV conjugative transfer system lipoprotein TraV [Burkholderia glumae]|uniref:type IV conjugative transfer system lipoprotein TraV n=1 Tax=Burkholderia glumae TaxID=337 RepID=UPI00216446C1|nr:type IV conjugative transfer system lipoprotein TraV [Burkholderia glumae]UVT00144.1 type IV conjugative transfer system protein TraV [Burkholderia glumae]
MSIPYLAATRETAVIGAAVLALSACSFTGYDASSSFACKAPAGVLCNSMSGIYANAMAHNLPDQRVHAGSGAETNLTLGSYADDSPADRASGSRKAAAGGARATSPGILPRALDSGAPVRTAPRELRVWFAPWQDADSDLHDQEYVYLVVDPGHWSIAHNQARIRAAFQPVLPPVLSPTAAAAQGDAKDAGTAARRDAFTTPASNADRVMQGILTPDGAIDRAAAMSPSADR